MAASRTACFRPDTVCQVSRRPARLEASSRTTTRGSGRTVRLQQSVEMDSVNSLLSAEEQWETVQQLATISCGCC